MARTKSAKAKAEESELFVQLYPQCAKAVDALQMFNFGPEHANALLNTQQGKTIAAEAIRNRFERLTDRQQDKVIEASAAIAEHWPEFLHEKDFMNKDLQELDKALPEGWTLEDTASPREKAQQAISQSNSASATSRLPSAGQAALAAAGLAAAGGAVASWRDREQMRNAPQQDTAKGQGKLAKTLAFAAGAAVLLGGAFYAYNRSQGQGMSR